MHVMLCYVIIFNFYLNILMTAKTVTCNINKHNAGPH